MTYKINKDTIDKFFPKPDIGEYESPIHLITDQLATQISKRADENIWEAVVNTGVVVDKEELIKALQYDRGQYDKGYRNGYTTGYTANKWILVEDRLPEENGTYLVVGKSGTPHTAHFYKERTIYGKTISAHFSNRYVTHWQFLPEPPIAE